MTINDKTTQAYMAALCINMLQVPQQETSDFYLVSESMGISIFDVGALNTRRYSSLHYISRGTTCVRQGQAVNHVLA